MTSIETKNQCSRDNFNCCTKKIPFPPDFKIEEHIISKYGFRRLKRLCNECDPDDSESDEDCLSSIDETEDCFCHITYAKFVNWNVAMFNMASVEDKFFIKMLCERLYYNKVKMADEEYYTHWTAKNIYFNRKGCLVITHPR